MAKRVAIRLSEEEQRRLKELREEFYDHTAIHMTVSAYLRYLINHTYEEATPRPRG